MEIETPTSLEFLERRVDGSRLWLDVSEHNRAEELAPLIKTFNLHPSAVEDCYNVRQRPKMDEYEENLFIIARTVFKDPVYTEGHQLGIFLGRDFLITIHVRPMPQLDIVLEDLRKG